jgi:hypothetical protein
MPERFARELRRSVEVVPMEEALSLLRRKRGQYEGHMLLLRLSLEGLHPQTLYARREQVEELLKKGVQLGFRFSPHIFEHSDENSEFDGLKIAHFAITPMGDKGPANFKKFLEAMGVKIEKEDKPQGGKGGGKKGSGNQRNFRPMSPGLLGGKGGTGGQNYNSEAYNRSNFGGADTIGNRPFRRYK